ncbi:HNH endonuclease [Serratia marcescens]|uniref:HNH endonuclease n=1 Tax=Serratia marcescens TaxID=615 RepID=UPI0006681104|nr:HNH endonuclease [Serratia marcescens]
MKELDTLVVRALFNYNPDTGVLTNRVTRGNSKTAEKGGISTNRVVGGYKIVKIFGITHMEHTVCYVHHHGALPDGFIDHINRDRGDNRIANLRVVNRRQNNINTRIRSDNASGFKGVSFHKKSGKWISYVSVNNKRHHLGYFDTPELAHDARQRFISGDADFEYYS